MPQNKKQKNYCDINRLQAKASFNSRQNNQIFYTQLNKKLIHAYNQHAIEEVFLTIRCAGKIILEIVHILTLFPAKRFY